MAIVTPAIILKIVIGMVGTAVVLHVLIQLTIAVQMQHGLPAIPYALILMGMMIVAKQMIVHILARAMDL
jgi:hypothetical protein